MEYLRNDLTQHDWIHQNSVSCEGCGQNGPGKRLKGDAFVCYVITQLQADKADNSELINNRGPGAALLARRY